MGRKWLDKFWLRILVAILLGAASAEYLHLITGDPNRPRTPGLAAVYGVAWYFALTLANRLLRKSK